jgi:hypothetical protein
MMYQSPAPRAEIGKFEQLKQQGKIYQRASLMINRQAVPVLFGSFR